MISFDLDRIVREFIDGGIGIGELWDQTTRLPLEYGPCWEEADVFHAVRLCERHICDDAWSEAEGRDYLREEMRRHPTVAGEWEAL